jgi:hypothetical protein
MEHYRFLHEITEDDVGKSTITKQCKCCGHKTSHWITGAMGRILSLDVGKRLYIRNNVITVESQEQLQERLSRG